MKNISPDLLKQLLRYDPNTGKLFWNIRSSELFPNEASCKSWNTKYGNKEAFTSTDENGYYQGAILGKNHRAHRVVWALVHGKWPDNTIDHINGNTGDNRISNLRDVPHQINHQNQKESKRNKSGVTGVTWHEKMQKWIVQIRSDGKNRYLGSFETIEEATKVRKDSEVKYGFHENHGRPRCT